MPSDTATRIRAKLQRAVGEGASVRALFLYAVQQSDAAGIGRGARFNALYGYHRSLVTLIMATAVVFTASAFWGAVAHWPRALITAVALALLLMIALFWNRTRQRAFYYAREVLLTTERVLDQRGMGGAAVVAMPKEK